MSDKCRSCDAPVMWLEHATTGKRAPIDWDAAPDGNIRLGVALEHYIVLSGDERQDALARGDPLHLNHYVTCPHAAAWKKRQGARP
jgi:hypothetical protein